MPSRPYVGEGVGNDVPGVLLGMVFGVAVGEADADADAVGVPSVVGETSAVADASGDGLGRVPTGARPHADAMRPRSINEERIFGAIPLDTCFAGAV